MKQDLVVLKQQETRLGCFKIAVVQSSYKYLAQVSTLTDEYDTVPWSEAMLPFLPVFPRLRRLWLSEGRIIRKSISSSVAVCDDITDSSKCSV